MKGSRSFLLTGCAGGIGRHLAETLIDRGHDVTATDVHAAGLEDLARRWPSVRIRRLDVREPEAWESIVREMPKLDVLMNIAGYLRPGWIHETTAEEVHRHLDINAKGVVLGTCAAARRMVEQRRGHIVNIASMAGLAPIPGIALYSASKYAVRGFSLAAAQELRSHGVYVTVVCPDAVQTPMFDLQKSYDEAALTFSTARVLRVEEVGRAILAALDRRPLEVFLPARRGWLARFADVFPRTSFILGPMLRKQGRSRQAKLRKPCN